MGDAELSLREGSWRRMGLGFGRVAARQAARVGVAQPIRTGSQQRLAPFLCACKPITAKLGFARAPRLVKPAQTTLPGRVRCPPGRQVKGWQGC